MIWVLKKFTELSTSELYTILKLRAKVFVVEQNCAYQDIDGKDQDAYHLFAFKKEYPDQILAYTRLFAPGSYYKQAAIGRVIVDPISRGTGLGHQLINNSIQHINNLFHTKQIKIGAQLYLKKFYEEHGFKQIGEGYLEDGIPHIHMLATS